MGGLMVRAVLSFGAVLGVMALVARAARGRLGIPTGPRAVPMKVEVLARQTIGRNAAVAVVRAGGKGLVIGITESSVTVLADADPDALPPAVPAEAPAPAASRPRRTWTALPAPATAGARPTWKGLIAMARESTVRR